MRSRENLLVANRKPVSPVGEALPRNDRRGGFCGPTIQKQGHQGMRSFLFRYLSIIIASAVICSAPANADEFASIRERLVAARSQDDWARIYQGIERNFYGNATKI